MKKPPPNSVARTSTDLARIKRLRHRVRSLRWKLVIVTTCTGIISVLAGSVAVLAAEMLADWQLELPWAMRCTWVALGAVGLIGWFVARFCHWPHENAVALLIERTMPSFRGRFIAAIQLSHSKEPGMSGALVRALLAETASIEAQLDFGGVVSLAPFRQAVTIVLALVVIAGSSIALTRPLSEVLLKRALLFQEPMPRATRLTVPHGDQTVALGENVMIEALASGVLPGSGTLIVKTASGRTSVYSMEPDTANRSRFQRILESVQESFTYSIHLNDAETPEYRVAALPRPTITHVDCEQVFPAYTGQPPIQRSLANLVILAGSQLNLKMSASANLKEASVKLAGSKVTVPARIDRYDRKRIAASFTIPAKAVNGFSIQLIDEHGIPSRDSATHRIEVVPDRPPMVKITVPDRQEELVTPQGTLPLAFEATDDFGIGRATLHYLIRSEATGSGQDKTSELDIGSTNARSIAPRFDWKVGTAFPHVSPGTTIDYWIEVADRNNATGPGVGATPRYVVKIVTPEEKRAEIAARLMDTFQGLNDLATDQEKLNKDVGSLIPEKKSK